MPWKNSLDSTPKKNFKKSKLIIANGFKFKRLNIHLKSENILAPANLVILENSPGGALYCDFELSLETLISYQGKEYKIHSLIKSQNFNHNVIKKDPAYRFKYLIEMQLADIALLFNS